MEGQKRMRGCRGKETNEGRLGVTMAGSLVTHSIGFVHSLVLLHLSGGRC